MPQDLATPDLDRKAKSAMVAEFRAPTGAGDRCPLMSAEELDAAGAVLDEDHLAGVTAHPTVQWTASRPGTSP
ncbi:MULTISPECIES: hypothetical protein [Streptomyces]